MACIPVAKHFSSKEESVPVLNPHVPWQGEKAKFKGVLTGAVQSGVCSSCGLAGDPVTWPSPHLAAAGLPHLWSSYRFSLFGGVYHVPHTLLGSQCGSWSWTGLGSKLLCPRVGFPGGSVCKASACNAEDIGDVGGDDLLEKGMATHSSSLA